jgi:hypothetical protein
LEKLEALRTELADLAFDLESRGRVDAADVAGSVSARLKEIRKEVGVRDAVAAAGSEAAGR